MLLWGKNLISAYPLLNSLVRRHVAYSYASSFDLYQHIKFAFSHYVYIVELAEIRQNTNL